MALTPELRRDIEERISKIKDQIDAVWPPTSLKELDEWIDLHRQWNALERLLCDKRHA